MKHLIQPHIYIYVKSVNSSMLEKKHYWKLSFTGFVCIFISKRPVSCHFKIFQCKTLPVLFLGQMINLLVFNRKIPTNESYVFYK